MALCTCGRGSRKHNRQVFRGIRSRTHTVYHADADETGLPMDGLDLDHEEDYTRQLLKLLYSALYSALFSPGKWALLLPRMTLGFNTRSIPLRRVQHPARQGGRRQHTAAAPRRRPAPTGPAAATAGQLPGFPLSGNRHSPTPARLGRKPPRHPVNSVYLISAAGAPVPRDTRQLCTGTEEQY